MNNLYSIEIYEVSKKNYKTNLLLFYKKDHTYSKFFEETQKKSEILRHRFYKNNKNIKIEKILEDEVETDNIEFNIKKYINSDEDKIFDNSNYLYGVVKINQLYCEVIK